MCGMPKGRASPEAIMLFESAGTSSQSSQAREEYKPKCDLFFLNTRELTQIEFPILGGIVTPKLVTRDKGSKF
jgi:hypothetical protein